MRKIPLPQIPLVDHLRRCALGVSNDNLRVRLNNAEIELSAASLAFDTLVKNTDLHLFPRNQSVSDVTDNEMSNLYSTQMSAANGAARSTYDLLINAAPFKKCPHCGVNVANTLDHHLPKSQYPLLAVTPINLVPCCSDCNKAKGTRYPREKADQLINPYYDEFTNTKWIDAIVERSDPLVVRFDANTPNSWEISTAQRAHHHFKVFKLGLLFGLNAAEDLVTLRSTIINVWQNEGPSGLSSFLFERANDYKSRLNSWQHSLYIALASDQWFLTGGFQRIAVST